MKQPPPKTDPSSPTKLDAQEFERLSQRVGALERIQTADSWPPSDAASTDLAEIRHSLQRARDAFRRLGNGSFALSALTLGAFLKVLFDGNLTALPCVIIVAAALFLGLVGYVFHMQADSLNIGDTR